MQEDLDYLQKPSILNRIEQVKKAKDDNAQMRAILSLFNEIRNSSKSIVDEIGSGVSISNLDEVTTALHNENNKNTKLLLAALKDLKLSNEKQAKIMAEITKANQEKLEDEYQTVRIVKPRDKVTVTNLSDIPLTEEVKINNLSEILDGLKQLEKVIEKSLKITVESPQVTVNPPEVNVNVPQSNIDAPEINLDQLIDSVEEGLQKLRQNNKSNPLFVRMMDLDKMFGKLDEIREASRNVMLGFPGSVALRDVNGGIADPNTFGGAVSLIANKLGDNSKVVTTSGTRVQLLSSSTPCKWVVVTAKSGNAGTIYIGGVTIAVGRGKPLVNLQETEIKISDVSQIWMDADTNGDGCVFYYGS